MCLSVLALLISIATAIMVDRSSKRCEEIIDRMFERWNRYDGMD